MGAVHTLSDQQLVSLLREGNQDAYIEIYDRYKVILQQHACKKLDNLDEVEDILQEMFIHIWDKKETLNITTSLSGYLFTVARNRIFNLYHKKKRELGYLNSLQEFIDKGEYSTDLLLRERELNLIIEKEIQALPPRMREVFMLSRNEGLTHKQIAQRLGTSEQTVTTQIRNSLKVLRLKLGSLFVLMLF